MKKDIKIPEVEKVYIAVVNEAISQSDQSEWSVYIINDGPEDLELIIIVSTGFSKSKQTSTLRKTIDNLPKKSYAKVELIQDNLLEFTNQFKVSFFKDNQLYDRTYTFKPGSMKVQNLSVVPLLHTKGILAE